MGSVIEQVVNAWSHRMASKWCLATLVRESASHGVVCGSRRTNSAACSVLHASQKQACGPPFKHWTSGMHTPLLPLLLTAFNMGWPATLSDEKCGPINYQRAPKFKGRQVKTFLLSVVAWPAHVFLSTHPNFAHTFVRLNDRRRIEA